MLLRGLLWQLKLRRAEMAKRMEAWKKCTNPAEYAEMKNFYSAWVDVRSVRLNLCTGFALAFDRGPSLVARRSGPEVAVTHQPRNNQPDSGAYRSGSGRVSFHRRGMGVGERLENSVTCLGTIQEPAQGDREVSSHGERENCIRDVSEDH